jgi:hypothetical protein
MTGDFGAVTLAARAGIARDRAFLGTSALLFVRECGGDDLLVRIHVRRHADAGRLDHVHGVDEDARADLARRGRLVPGTRLGGLTALVGAGYFFVWSSRRGNRASSDAAGRRRVAGRCRRLTAGPPGGTACAWAGIALCAARPS